ncbi:MAG: DMT family transporter, partial [Candidatus Korarchaeum sp.]|nr:DMT family transporter [Candidatus Korarchaeum sp.]MDW8035075.1 DMT family transporter [Candidatus Korarchaeum sp.]
LLLIISSLLGDLKVPPLVAIPYILLNTALGTGAADYLFLKSIALIGPSRATPIGFTYLIWSALLPSFMISEPFSAKVLLGAASALAGIRLISKGGGKWAARGVAFSLIASLGWTLGPIAAKVALNHVSELTLTTWNSVIVTLTYGVLSAPSFKVKGFGKAAIGGSLGVGIALPLYFYAVKELGVAIASLTTALGPVVSLILSSFSGGKLDRDSALGGTLVVAGILAAVV